LGDDTLLQNTGLTQFFGKSAGKFPGRNVVVSLMRIKKLYSPFCVPAKVTKLIGLKRPPFLSPTNLIIFACTQNGE
jgi:hypothetical protein